MKKTLIALSLAASFIATPALHAQAKNECLAKAEAGIENWQAIIF